MQLSGRIAERASDNHGRILLGVDGLGRGIEQRIDAAVAPGQLDATGFPRAVWETLPIARPVFTFQRTTGGGVRLKILVGPHCVKPPFGDSRRVKGVDAVGGTGSGHLHVIVRQPVQDPFGQRAEVSRPAAHQVVDVAIRLERRRGRQAIVRRIDVSVPDVAVGIRWEQHGPEWRHRPGWEPPARIPRVGVGKSEVVADLVGQGAGLTVEEAVRTAKVSGLRERIEQHVGEIIIAHEIAELCRLRRGLGKYSDLLKYRPDFAVIIPDLRQAQQGREGRLDAQGAVGVFIEKLVVRLDGSLGAVLILRRHRVVGEQRPHVEKLLDALGRAAARRGQRFGGVAGRSEPTHVPALWLIVQLRQMAVELRRVRGPAEREEPLTEFQQHLPALGLGTGACGAADRLSGRMARRHSGPRFLRLENASGLRAQREDRGFRPLRGPVHRRLDQRDAVQKQTRP